MMSHIRYFILTEDENKNKIKKFRYGGFLFKTDYDNGYVVLTNYRISWCVQCKDTIFYKKISQKDINIKYDDELNEIKKKILDYENMIDFYKNKYYDEKNKSLNYEDTINIYKNKYYNEKNKTINDLF
jgi:hypothetical protein